MPPQSVYRCADYPSAPGGSSRRRTRPVLGRTLRTCSRFRNRRASTRCLRPVRVSSWRRKGSRSCESTDRSRSSVEAVSPAPDVRRRLGSGVALRVKCFLSNAPLSASCSTAHGAKPGYAWGGLGGHFGNGRYLRN